MQKPVGHNLFWDEKNKLFWKAHAENLYIAGQKLFSTSFVGV